jgi:hypothetical protein
MAHKNRQEQWMQDIRERQRSVVFPETLKNEVRFWQNLKTGRPKLFTWIGITVLALWIVALAVGMLLLSLQERNGRTVLLGTALLFGTIFGAIAWATRRNLRNLENHNHKSDNGKA